MTCLAAQSQPQQASTPHLQLEASRLAQAVHSVALSAVRVASVNFVNC